MNNVRCKINDHLTIALIDVKERQGHDDSRPFDADLYFFFNGAKNGLKIGCVSNDGYGEPNNIFLFNTDTQEGKINKTELDIAKEYIKNNFTFSYRGVKYPCDLDLVLSCMVENALEGKEELVLNSLEM